MIGLNPPGFPGGSVNSAELANVKTAAHQENFRNNDIKPEKVFEIHYYQENDTGPYRVHVELIRTDINRDKDLSKLRVGQLLEKKLNVKNIVDTKKFGKKTITVYPNSIPSANQLVDSGDLKNFGLKAYIPGSYLFVTGVIRDVDLEVDLEDLEQELKSKYPVHKVERMTRLNRDTEKREQTKSVRIIFRANKLPDYVVIYHTKIYISPFVGRVKLCKKCFRYGHYQEQCKSSEEKCGRCGESAHDNLENCIIKCIHCGLQHLATNPVCEEFKRQKNIKYFMAKNNIGYYEALDLFPQYTSKNSFELLQNMDDFPELSGRKTYSKITKATPKSRLVYREVKRKRTNSPKRNPNDFPKVDVPDPLAGKAYNFSNPHKTSDFERTLKQLNSSQNQNVTPCCYGEQENKTRQSETAGIVVDDWNGEDDDHMDTGPGGSLSETSNRPEWEV